MHQLVIARYAESLDWLADVPPGFEIHVYNKGAPITAAPVLARVASLTSRPNEGRESETYLTHMRHLLAEPGDAPDGFVVFAQGDPFEHSPDFLGLLQAADGWGGAQPLAWRWKVARDIPPAAVLARETAGHLGGLRVRPEPFSLQTWSPLGFHDVGTHWLQQTYRQVHALPEGTNIAAHFLAMCGLPDLAAAAAGHLLGRFSYGAVFAARRSRLLRLGDAALADLRRAALGHEVYGYVLERLWLHLAGTPFLLPAPLGDAAAPAVSGPIFVPPDTTSRTQRRLKRLASRLLPT